MADTTPYSVPQEPGRWRAIGLAVLVHAALFAFLWIGIRWQNETPVAVEAEVWDMQAKEAAPQAVLPPPEPPKPEVERQPRPQHESEPVSKSAPRPDAKEPVENPDIALALEKKKKEKAKREEEERIERLAQLKEQKAQAEQEKKKEQKAQEEKEKKERTKKEKEKQAALEKEKAALEQEKAEALAKKDKADAAKKRQQEAQDAKLAAKMREDTMKRITGATGAVAGSGGAGTAAKSQGMRGDPGYAGKVAAKIKSNTAFSLPPDLQGNPAVEYDVQLFPDGSLRGAPRKVKSSGIPAFDDAVRRAIELSAPFPADKSGAVPSGFPVIHRPKEQ